MNISFRMFKYLMFFLIAGVSSLSLYSQSETSRWKAQIAFGFNYPDVDGFLPGFEAKPVNFPTINLGVQHMFSPNMGAKLDFGYNRFSNAKDSSEFKTNYSRINAQFVYDATRDLPFLPSTFGIIGHVGPGISFIKPLGNFSDNNHSYFNALAGIELHYRIAQTVSVFTDASYIIRFSSDTTYDPITEGYGTFHNNLFNITLGLSVSLSGCQYCD